MSTRPLLPALALLAVSACAHAPAARPRVEAGAPAERVLVTGSRIPQRVDPRTGLPATASPVVVYTREDVTRSGVGGEVGAALRKLDPSLRP